MIGLAVIAKRENQIDAYYAKICEIFKLEPGNFIANIYLAEHYFYKGDYAKARKLASLGLQTIDKHILISKADKRNPPRLDMRTVKSKYYYILGFIAHETEDKYENAMKFYTMAVDVNPDNTPALFGLGQINLARVDFKLNRKTMTKQFLILRQL